MAKPQWVRGFGWCPDENAAVRVDEYLHDSKRFLYIQTCREFVINKLPLRWETAMDLRLYLDLLLGPREEYALAAGPESDAMGERTC